MSMITLLIVVKTPRNTYRCTLFSSETPYKLGNHGFNALKLKMADTIFSKVGLNLAMDLLQNLILVFPFSRAMARWEKAISWSNSC